MIATEGFMIVRHEFGNVAGFYSSLLFSLFELKRKEQKKLKGESKRRA